MDFQGEGGAFQSASGLEMVQQGSPEIRIDQFGQRWQRRHHSNRKRKRKRKQRTSWLHRRNQQQPARHAQFRRWCPFHSATTTTATTATTRTSRYGTSIHWIHSQPQRSSGTPINPAIPQFRNSAILQFIPESGHLPVIETSKRLIHRRKPRNSGIQTKKSELGFPPNPKPFPYKKK